MPTDEWTAQQERERKLRADLQAAEERAEDNWNWRRINMQQRDEAEARIVTLQGALERIVEAEGGKSPSPTARYLAGIARAALASTPQPSEGEE